MSVTVELGGRAAELHAPGFLWLADARLLCAADLHFEKGSFFHNYGSLLPPYDTRETLRLLEQGLQQFKPDRFIALGDSFHDAKGAERLGLEERGRLNSAIDRVAEWIWVTGNHDPSIAEAVRGARHEQVLDGNWVFRHKATIADEVEVSGHYHPKTTLRLRRHRISCPCFVQNGGKLILPAFGSFTGGLDIDSQVISAILPAAGRRAFAVHKQQVYAL